MPGFYVLYRGLLLTVLCFAPPQKAPDDFVLNFESPLYAPGADIDGVDGWHIVPAIPKGTKDAPLGAITPTEKSGYPQVLAGKQSLAIFANGRSYLHAFPADLKLQDGCKLSWRMWMEVAQGEVGVYLGYPLAKGGTPIGVEARMVEGKFYFFGGDAEQHPKVEVHPKHEYLVEIVLNFTEGKMQGFVTDLTEKTERESLGTQTNASSKLDPAEVVKNGGIIITKSSTVVVLDDIRIDPPAAK